MTLHTGPKCHVSFRRVGGRHWGILKNISNALTKTYALGNAKSECLFRTYWFSRTADNFLVSPLWEKGEETFDFILFFPQRLHAAQFVVPGCKLSTS